MGIHVDTLKKGSDNDITYTLTENGVAITNTPTDLTIDIGGLVSINRTSFPSNGIAFASGVVTISPGDLTEDLSSLLHDTVHRVKTKFIDGSNSNGVVYGAGDSDDLLYFRIEDAS